MIQLYNKKDVNGKMLKLAVGLVPRVACDHQVSDLC